MNHISAAAAVLSNQTRGETVIIIFIFSATYFALFVTLYPFMILIHFNNSKKPII